MTGSFSDMTADDWTFIRSINLDGVVNCCSAFTPPMLAARRGQVVNVSSGLGFTPTAKESAYGAPRRRCSISPSACGPTGRPRVWA